MNEIEFFPLQTWLKDLGLVGYELVWTQMLIMLVFMISLAWAGDFVSKKVFLSTIKRIVKKSKTIWDDILLDKNVFSRIAHFVPALIIYSLAPNVFSDFPNSISNFVQSSANLYMVIMLIILLSSLLDSVKGIYETIKISENRPITGYIQLVKIMIYLFGGIIVLSILLNKSPIYFITGLGAFAAVLLLVFKDTIMGFVASIQLSANKMVKPGDWIEVPNYKADGVVTEITLNTVKIQNWNKTICTVPTYALVDDSFSNWKGMEESGGRRIKRSLLIDMESIRFCNDKILEKFEKIKLITEYINEKRGAINNENKKIETESSSANIRKLTNVGVFRIYIENYLKANPHIHNNMTFLVRQLQPTEKGLPIEIYVFSKNQDWAPYEAIQSDIFDHLLAIINEFDLRVFQNPSGYNFKNSFAKASS